MMDNAFSSTQPIICLLGATGTGKSAVALSLALQCNGEIINADSRQVYKDFPLIAALPDEEAMQRVPHHLYAFLSASESISAGTWARMAEQHICDCHTRGKIPILVGGTGMYIKALFNPIVAIPPIPEAVRQEIGQDLQKKGLASLYSQLECCDLTTAKRLHPNDTQRIVRALEVWRHTGVTLSAWHLQSPAPRPAKLLRLGLQADLNALSQRLFHRIQKMVQAGAVAEVEQAFELFSKQQKQWACLESMAVYTRQEIPSLSQSYTAQEPPTLGAGWSSIGCRELLAWLCGHVDLDTAKKRWYQNTRSYAKRQITWFKADPNILWHSAEAPEKTLFHALDWLKTTEKNSRT